MSPTCTRRIIFERLDSADKLLPVLVYKMLRDDDSQIPECLEKIKQSIKMASRRYKTTDETELQMSVLHMVRHRCLWCFFAASAYSCPAYYEVQPKPELIQAYCRRIFRRWPQRSWQLTSVVLMCHRLAIVERHCLSHQKQNRSTTVPMPVVWRQLLRLTVNDDCSEYLIQSHHLRHRRDKNTVHWPWAMVSN
jgi:hypothetical protein